jgi:hypothetical protein
VTRAEPKDNVAHRLEIVDVIYRYANALDAGLLDDVLECFTPDVYAEYNDAAIKLNGIGELREYLGRAIEAMRSQGVKRPSMHVMNNVTVAFHEGTATVETKGIAYLSVVPNGPIVVRGLVYSDHLINGADGWHIRQRSHRAEWQYQVDGQPVVPLV